jgi:hypothetical protein
LNLRNSFPAEWQISTFRNATFYKRERLKNSYHGKEKRIFAIEKDNIQFIYQMFV